MKLEGKYTLRLTGDTEHLWKVSGSNRNQIGYLFQRLLTGEEAAVEQEMPFWGVTVEQVQEGEPEAFRKLTEEDVELALADSYVPELAEIPPAVLLEFLQLMADRMAGE